MAGTTELVKADLSKLKGLTKVGYSIPQNMTHEQWTDVGRRLATIHGCILWWVGDWLAFGERAKWGEVYDKAKELFGYEYMTLAQACRVSKAVSICRRLQNLRWAHHQEVAALPPKDQTRWLVKAEKHEWTSKELRNRIREAKHAAYLDQNKPAGPPEVTLCSWDDWIHEYTYDLLLTDPPYSTDVDDIDAFAARWLPTVLHHMKPTGRAYVFIGAYPRELSAYLNVQQPDQVLVWTYRNTLGPSPADEYKLNWQAILYYKGGDAPDLDCPIMTEQFTVHDVTAPDNRLGDKHHRYHAWQKPDELAERLIRHSTAPGDIVVDPFVGTGTFVLAASRLGRQGCGCDIDKDNLDIAISRGCELASSSSG